MDYFGELSNNSPRMIVQHIYSEGCPIEFYRKLNSVFSRTKYIYIYIYIYISFVLKTVFLTIGICMREGVNEGSRCGKG